MRPHDWHVLDLPGDPTPGDPWGVRSLSARLGSVGDDAADAERGMRSLAADNAVLSWVGLAGDVFRGAIDDLPGQLHKLADSYHRCSSALSSWADDLDGAQDQADRALVKGRVARARLDSLQGQLSAAQGSLSSASSSYDRLHSPPPGGTAPDPAQVSAALRSQHAAQSQVSALSGQIGDAQHELDLAKKLARDAAQVRDGAAERTKSRIDDAADAGIHNDSFWHHLGDAISKTWQVVVEFAKVVVVALGVVALIIGGPIAWVVFAAALVLLADSLMKYARGDGSLWDVGLAALGCIPGTRGLTTLGELSSAFRTGGMLAAGGHVLSAGRTALRDMAITVRSAPGLLKGIPSDFRVALADFQLTRARSLTSMEPASARVVSRAGVAATPDGMLMMASTREVVASPSAVQELKAAAAGLRSGIDEWGTVRTAQLTKNGAGQYDALLRYRKGWDPYQRSQADAKAAFLTDGVTRYRPDLAEARVKSRTVSWGNQHPPETSHKSLFIGGEGYQPGYKFDVDHAKDLQLGGLDRPSNFRHLEASVNRSEGAQVASLIRRANLQKNAELGDFWFEERGIGIWSGVRSTSWVGTAAVGAD